MLSLKQLNDVCLHNQGASQCRFLAEDDKGKFYCIKYTSSRSAIDDEVAEFKTTQKSQGNNPYNLSMPIGDNCKGYTFFRHKLQGYDVP